MAFEINQLCGKELMSPELTAMFRFRHDVFIKRLNWDLPDIGELEIDQFDGVGADYIVATRDDRCVGSWRLLPTVGSYMLKDVFPQLLRSAEIPADPVIWELSRFAVATEERGAFGFGAETRAMFREAHSFAVRKGINRYVTVTTTALERLLRHAKVKCVRLGEPVRIASGMAVALSLSPSDLGRAGSIAIQAVEPRYVSPIQITSREARDFSAGSQIAAIALGGCEMSVGRS
jgi:acyl homoserine lactone synthase